MIAALLAQELRSTWKNLLSTVGIAALVAAVSFTITALRVPVLGTFLMGVGVLAVVAITPLVLGILAENYWRTMYGREGYFTMALPVHGRTLFAVKAVYASIATLAAAAVTLVGAGAAYVVSAVSRGTEFGRALDLLFTSTISQIGPGTSWFLVACIVLQLVFTVIAGAAAMSVGAEGRFNHLGFGAPVLGTVLLYVAMQIVVLASILFVPVGVRLTGPDAGSLVGEGMLGSFVDALSDSNADPDVLGLGFLPVIAIIAVLLAWWGARSVERRTSLR